MMTPTMLATRATAPRPFRESPSSGVAAAFAAATGGPTLSFFDGTGVGENARASYSAFIRARIRSALASERALALTATSPTTATDAAAAVP